MKKSIRLDLIKLINADTFVAFDDKVRDMMTRAHESFLDAPYIKVNGKYTTYQCFLNAYRLGKYSAADFVCLCYDTDTCEVAVAATNGHPAELAAVEYDAPVYIDASEHDERVKDAVDDHAAYLKSYLFGAGNPLVEIEGSLDKVRGYLVALNRADATAMDGAGTMREIAALLSAVHADAERAWVTAATFAAKARATIKALEG